MKKQKKFLDIAQTKKEQDPIAGFFDASQVSKFRTTLFSRGKKTEAFFTEDSKLYITPKEQIKLRAGISLDRDIKKWDALSSRVVNKFVRYNPSQTSLLLKALEERYAMFNEEAVEATRGFLGQFSTARLWNASIIGSILFGMVMMTFVYRYLGQGASAKQVDMKVAAVEQVESEKGMVLGVADTKDDAQSFAKQVAEIQQVNDKQSLEAEIREVVGNTPIRKMAPFIAQQDRTVAAFIVAIAMKESSFGVHVPVLNGQDCNNYWGYRGKRQLMGTGGHTCFNSPEDAVNTVAKRIKTLVEEQGLTTPDKMVKTWKCGGRCDLTGGQAAADKWAVDVNGVFKKFKMNDVKN